MLNNFDDVFLVWFPDLEILPKSFAINQNADFRLKDGVDT